MHQLHSGGVEGRAPNAVAVGQAAPALLCGRQRGSFPAGRLCLQVLRHIPLTVSVLTSVTTPAVALTDMALLLSDAEVRLSCAGV